MSRKSDSSKAAVWRRRFQRFKASNVSVAKFCATEKCSPASFYYWRKKLARTKGPQVARARPPAFRQLSLVPSPISIELPGGALVNVTGDNLEAIRTIVREAMQVEPSRNEGGSSC